eukprot:jgi/Chlat1/2102/Chrsp17S02696
MPFVVPNPNSCVTAVATSPSVIGDSASDGGGGPVAAEVEALAQRLAAVTRTANVAELATLCECVDRIREQREVSLKTRLIDSEARRDRAEQAEKQLSRELELRDTEKRVQADHELRARAMRAEQRLEMEQQLRSEDLELMMRRVEDAERNLQQERGLRIRAETSEKRELLNRLERAERIHSPIGDGFQFDHEARGPGSDGAPETNRGHRSSRHQDPHAATIPAQGQYFQGKSKAGQESHSS